MFITCLILLWSSAMAPVDSAVASAVETAIAARTHASHEIEYRFVPRELTHIDPHATVRIVDEPRTAYRGTVTLPVEVVSSNESRRYLLSVRVRTFEAVAVAATMINKHDRLAHDQIVMQSIETTALSSTPVTDANAVTGLRSKLIIVAGSVITEPMLEPVPVIVCGAHVLVRVHRDNVTLSVSGTAKRDGWAGSLIPVEVSMNRRAVNATVVDAQTVEVTER